MRPTRNVLPDAQSCATTLLIAPITKSTIAILIIFKKFITAVLIKVNIDIAEIFPKAELLAVLAERDASADDMFDPEGFHATDTLDYVYVLDGPVELKLEVDSVVLQAGDCVVQRRTKHTWHNHNDHPIRLLSVLVRSAESGVAP